MLIVPSLGFMLSEIIHAFYLLFWLKKKKSYSKQPCSFYMVKIPHQSVSLIDLKMAALNKRYFHFYKILGFSKVLFEDEITNGLFLTLYCF